MKNSRFLSFVLLGLSILTVWCVESHAATTKLKTKMTLEISEKPFFETLASIENQTGVQFSYFPEWFSKDKTIKAISFKGSLKDGLDHVCKSLGAKWNIGIFGGIVLLPLDRKYVNHEDWILDTFETTGVEIVEAQEYALRAGFKTGDVIIALNGEIITNFPMLNETCNLVKLGVPATATVQRGAEQIQIKLANKFPTRGAGLLGLNGSRYRNFPSLWTIYQKGGHRNKKWDKKVRAAFNAYDKKTNPVKFNQLISNCLTLGCRDPLLPRLMASTIERGYGPGAWEELNKGINKEQLEAAYGGSLFSTRISVLKYFGVKAPSKFAAEIEHQLEAAWEWVPHDQSANHRKLAYAAANRHFIRGEYKKCILIMKPFESWYSNNYFNHALIQIEALHQLGKYKEAITLFKTIYKKFDGGYASNTLAGLKATARIFKKTPSLVDDRSKGMAGLWGYKAMSTFDAIGMFRSRGMKIQDIHAADRSRGGWHGTKLNTPLPENAEILLFTRMSKLSSTVASPWVGMFLAAGNSQNSRGWSHLWKGASITIGSKLSLHLYIPSFSGGGGSGGYQQALPLPGFANNGFDIIRILKTKQSATIRCNHLKVSIIGSSSFANKGEATAAVFSCRANYDAAYFVPTTRCYDNDAIRALMDKIRDPNQKLSVNEAIAAWDEATLLSPPQSQLKQFRPFFTQLIKDPPKAPAYPGDAPPLKPLTEKDAKARFTANGEATWIMKDPGNRDLIWCFRNGGRIQSMSRLRYWTTDYSLIPRTLRPGLVIKKPVITNSTLWIPTNKGLFKYDRQGGSFRRMTFDSAIQNIDIKTFSVDRYNIKVSGTCGSNSYSWIQKR